MCQRRSATIREPTARVKGDSGHGMHVGLGNVLDNNWNVIIPSSNRFVVGRRHESSILVDEGNGVDRSQVLVVCLDYLVRSCIVLCMVVRSHRLIEVPTHLYDLLVLHTCQEDVLLVGVRMVFDHIGNLAIREGLDALAGLCIPDLDMPIIRGRQELRALRVESDILDRL